MAEVSACTTTAHRLCEPWVQVLGNVYVNPVPVPIPIFSACVTATELFGRGVSSINQENLSKIPGAGDESRRPGSARGGAQRG